MAKRTKVPKIYEGVQHIIPACDVCGENMVKFRGKWLCRDCMVIPVQAIPGWDVEDVSFRVLYPNRHFRRHT